MKIRDIVAELKVTDFQDTEAPTTNAMPPMRFMFALYKYLSQFMRDMPASDRQEIHREFEQHMRPMAEPRHVCRSLVLPAKNSMGPAGNLWNRQTVQFDNYTSTTTVYEFAEKRMLENRVGGVYAMLHITTKPGARAIMVNDYLDYFEELGWNYLETDVENEIILDAGCMFRVTERSKLKDDWNAKGIWSDNPAAEGWEIWLRQI